MSNESNSLLFCDRLREERVRLGFKQDEISAMCGVSRVMWGKYERDISEPTSSVLTALARVGADVNYILTGSRVQDSLDFSPIKQAALQAHKAATAMGRVSDKQFLGIFSAMLDGVVDMAESNEKDKINKATVTQTSNASNTVQIGGNNTGAISNDTKGRKRK